MPGQAAHAPVAPPRQGRLYALRGLVALVLIAALVGVVGAGEIGDVVRRVDPLALVVSARSRGCRHPSASSGSSRASCST